MAGYKERVAEDLDRWIAAGLVASDRREAILESIPNARRLDAASALAWVGAILLGVAVIAFIAANWSDIPRLARFAIVLGLYGAAAGAGAWFTHRGRPLIANGLLTFAGLVFAAAIGLTGQIFDIAGEPRAALYGAAVAAALLALAGRASGPAVAALIFCGAADFADGGLFASVGGGLPVLSIAAPAGAILALAWRSVALAHASAIGALVACIWVGVRSVDPGTVLLFLSLLMGMLAAGGRWLQTRERRMGSAFFGWFTWGAICLFVIAGYAAGGGSLDIPHRLAWLALAGGLIAVGRHDRHVMVSAAGVVALLGAIAALLADLGLELMTAAALFFAMALAALVVGFLLNKRARR
jgi:uncharacterized membrane protein